MKTLWWCTAMVLAAVVAPGCPEKHGPAKDTLAEAEVKDAPADAPVKDAPADAGPDTAPDVPVDPRPQPDLDVHKETLPDTHPAETLPEVEPDHHPDAPPDTAGEAGPDAALPETADAPADPGPTDPGKDDCVPDCASMDKQCGDDGCGGSCGSCDDALECTADVCVCGYCHHAAMPGHCLIDDGAGPKCVPANASNPDMQCWYCVPTKNRFAWTPVTGGPCTKPPPDTMGDCCKGNCVGFGDCPYPVWSCPAGAECCFDGLGYMYGGCDDGLECTQDSCIPTGDQTAECQHLPTPGSCATTAPDGTPLCVPAGLPLNLEYCDPCIVCDPATGFGTQAPDGTPCGDGLKHCCDGECISIPC